MEVMTCPGDELLCYTCNLLNRGNPTPCPGTLVAFPGAEVSCFSWGEKYTNTSTSILVINTKKNGATRHHVLEPWLLFLELK